MKKQYKNINSLDFNKRRYNSIMESILPEIQRVINEEEDDDDNDLDDLEEDDLEEKVLNELFGIGSSVKKPEKALSLDNSDDINAELAIQWCAYFMAQAGNNVKKGIDAFIKECGPILVKIPHLLVKGVFMLLSGTIKGISFGVASVAAIILGVISILVKFVNSGIEKTKEALNTLYTTLSKGLSAFYTWFDKNASTVVSSSKEKVETWLGIMAGALMAVANKISGAAETMGDVFKKILSDAKEKKDGAVFLVKTWLSNKSEQVKKWISNTAGDIKSIVVKAWNAIEKKTRKAYDNIASKLEDWMKDISELISSISEKIGNMDSATKDFAIDKKDKALIWDIQKGVKGLSKNYTEDQVVALVRKCYNENLIPDIRGNYHINEAYFYKTGSLKRKLYENKKLNKKYRMLK